MAQPIYGIVNWWLAKQGYSDADFEIENTYSKTKDSSIDSVYDRIMSDAQNATPNPKLSDAIKDLAASNRNFRREHKGDIDTTIDSPLQEVFKNRIREEVDTQLGGMNIDTEQKSRVRSTILGEFESISLSDISSVVDENVREIFRTEVTEIPRMKEASLDILGVELDEEAWVGLRYSAFVEKDSDARSQYLRISNRMRTL